jgi:PAT family beta-lactamase induction signal transducer AmpG
MNGRDDRGDSTKLPGEYSIELLGEYLDGGLTPEAQAEVRAALERSPELALRLRRLRALRAALGAHFADERRPAPAPRYRHPLRWVPTSYLAMGLVYVFLSNVSTVMFSNMGMRDDQAAFWSSLLAFPYALKFLWAPLLELHRTKRFYVVGAQLLIAVAVGAAGLLLALPAAPIVAVVILLAAAGLIGTAQDIGSDGVYVTTLAPRDQARYFGVQSMAWNLGPILANGLLLHVAGDLRRRTGSYGTAWMVCLVGASILLLALGLYHSRQMPPGERAREAPLTARAAMHDFVDVFRSFFQKKDVTWMIAFAFFYRFGYGLIDKMGPLFMLAPRARGGLGLDDRVLGDLNGVIGTTMFIVGSLVGGSIVSRRGLKRTLLGLVLALNVPNVTMLFLSVARPSSLLLIGTIIALEKLAWGIGCVGHMIYMMQQIAPGPYRTTHYTIATALMGACMLVTGVLSGMLSVWVGYQALFVAVLLGAIPSIVFTLRAPFNAREPASAT